MKLSNRTKRQPKGLLHKEGILCNVYLARYYRKGRPNQPCGIALMSRNGKRLLEMHLYEGLIPPDYNGTLTLIPRKKSATPPKRK